MYLLIDCNNFYVSCERIFRPELNGKPVLVLSNNDGCVIARSNETKDMGIKMAEPYFQISDLVKSKNIKLFSTNFALYGNISARIANELSKFSMNLEVYSIDESFLYFADDEQDFISLAIKIRSIILKNIGVPVSIGIAKTKTLAKLASEIEKRGKGYFEISDENVDEVLKTQPISELWGVGSGYTKRLNNLGFKTAYDLKVADPKYISSICSINAKKTVLELNGTQCFPLEKQKIPKTMNHTRILAYKIDTIGDLKKLFAEFTSKSAHRLSVKGLCCTNLSIFISYKKDGKSKYMTYSSSFEPTDYLPTLIAKSHEAIDKIYKPKRTYWRAGLTYYGILPKSALTNSFFQTNLTTESKISKVAEKINSKYGFLTLRPASIPYEKIYRSKSEYLSNKFTSNWEELLEVQ